MKLFRVSFMSTYKSSLKTSPMKLAVLNFHENTGKNAMSNVHLLDLLAFYWKFDIQRMGSWWSRSLTVTLKVSLAQDPPVVADSSVEAGPSRLNDSKSRRRKQTSIKQV